MEGQIQLSGGDLGGQSVDWPLDNFENGTVLTFDGLLYCKINDLQATYGGVA